MAEAQIAYWLPETRVRATITVASAWAVDWAAKRIHWLPIPAVEVEFYAAADTTSGRGRAILRLDAGALRDADSTLQLHPDGRIASFASTQVAQLDAIVGNAARAVGLVAATALAFASPAGALAAGVATAGAVAAGAVAAAERAKGGDEELLGLMRAVAEDEAPDPAEALYVAWRATHAASAARGEALYETLTQIDASLSERLQALAAAPTGASATPAIAKGKSKSTAEPAPAPTAQDVKLWTELRAARDALAKDLDAIEAGARAWVEQAQSSRSTRVFSTPLRGLPAIDHLEPVVNEWPSDNGDDEPAAWPGELGVRIVRVDPKLQESGQEDREDQDERNDIKVRLSRPVTVGLYLSDAGESGPWTLTSTFDVAAVDKDSRVTHVPFATDRQADRTVTIVTGADGVTTSIGVVQASRAAELAAALRSGGEGVVAGASSAKDLLESVSSAQTSAGAIRSAGLTRSIADLELAKKKVDAELALASAVSARSLAEQKAQLEAQAAVLKQILEYGTTARAIAEGSRPASGRASGD